MVPIESRKGKKLFTYPNSVAWKYLHSCNDCGVDIYLTADEEKKQKGYCRKCSHKHRDLKIIEQFDTNGLKQCTKCKRDLPKEDFTYIKLPSGRMKYSSNCRKCTSLYVFGINAVQFQKLFDDQNGVCAICNRPETAKDGNRDRIKGLSVDHCHKNGNIRGLLCSKCNIILGNVNDDIGILLNAIEYLKKTSI